MSRDLMDGVLQLLGKTRGGLTARDIVYLLGADVTESEVERVMVRAWLDDLVMQADDSAIAFLWGRKRQPLAVSLTGTIHDISGDLGDSVFVLTAKGHFRVNPIIQIRGWRWP